MAPHKNYRLDNQPLRKSGATRSISRWLMAVFLAVGTFIGITVIAGSMLPDVLSTLFSL